MIYYIFTYLILIFSLEQGLETRVGRKIKTQELFLYSRSIQKGYKKHTSLFIFNWRGVIRL